VTISVNALFFASYRDLIGAGSLDVELSEGATVGDLVRALRGRGAPFDALPEEPAVAVNRTYAFLDEPLGADDEVAFIPPVAGG
jgi:molybdopterin converting factor subunit 1